MKFWSGGDIFIVCIMDGNLIESQKNANFAEYLLVAT